jgi:SAM-dependent methyltransferase
MRDRPAAGAFRETDIRPDDLMAGQREAQALDVEWLRERSASFVQVACPACGSSSCDRAFEKLGFSFSACRECATLYMTPRPSPETLDEFYATSRNYAYWNEFIFPRSEDARRENIFAPRAARVLELCRRYAIDTGTLLEVGAGFGTFCEEIGKTGTFERVLAVEPTPDLAATCRARGLEVIEQPIEHVDLGDRVANVIASFETIEHLFSPRRFLERCAELLAPGGLLVVSCPSCHGFDVLTLGAASGAIDNEHLNLFNPASLSALVQSCGFDVLEVLTPGRLDAEIVRKQAGAGAFDLGAHPWLHHVLVERWDELRLPFQEFLAENLLSSHLWLIAVRAA